MKSNMVTPSITGCFRTPVLPVILAVALTSLFAPGQTFALQEMQVIRNARLYSGPSSLSTRIRVMHPPEPVTRLDNQRFSNYVHVRTAQREVGWVYFYHLAERATPSSGGGSTPPTPLPAEPFQDGEMRAHFIDVGQGAAALLEFSCGAVLIDTGGEDNAEFHSNDALLRYLSDFFNGRPELNRTLDLVLLTHPHIDHTRGVRTVLDNFHVRNVVENGQSKGSGASEQIELRDFAQQEPDIGYEPIFRDQIPKTSGRTSQVIDPIACPDVDPQIRVLWGQVSTNPGWSSKEFGNPNNHSVAVRVDFGSFSFLITGDMEEVAIDDFVSRYSGTALLDVDLYEAGHHGSKNGTTEAFVQAMSLEAAVISMGPVGREMPWSGWQYGHPNKGIVEMLARGVTGTRDEIQVSLGIKGKYKTQDPVFEHGIPIRAAVYATGWDGTIVVTADSTGHVRFNR